MAIIIFLSNTGEVAMFKKLLQKQGSTVRTMMMGAIGR